MTPLGEGVDPRIAGRREEVLRENRRRLYRRLGVIVGVLFVCLGAVALTRSPLLDVDRIDVAGADRTGADTVHSVLSEVPGTPMVDVDEGSLAARLADLPWVETAEVRRRWPGTVEVRIAERVPVAVVPGGGAAWQLVDASGQVLEEQSGAFPDDLLVLEGAEPAGGPGDEVEGAEDLLAVAMSVTPEVEASISGIRFGRHGDLVMALDPSGFVRLGAPDQLVAKMTAIEVLLTRVDDRCIARIDVRVPSSPTITRVPECARGTPEPSDPGSGDGSLASDFPVPTEVVSAPGDVPLTGAQ